MFQAGPSRRAGCLRPASDTAVSPAPAALASWPELPVGILLRRPIAPQPCSLLPTSAPRLARPNACSRIILTVARSPLPRPAPSLSLSPLLVEPASFSFTFSCLFSRTWRERERPARLFFFWIQVSRFCSRVPASSVESNHLPLCRPADRPNRRQRLSTLFALLPPPSSLECVVSFSPSNSTGPLRAEIASCPLPAWPLHSA